MFKRVVILGITGSIGDSSCEVIRKNQDKFQIVLASAHNNWDKMKRLQEEFSIQNVVMTGKKELNIQADYNLYHGEEELLKLLADIDYDIVINAITGSAGLKSTYTILKRGKKLALANKESLIMAGHLMSQFTKDNPILPVDSEHSAIFQCIDSHKKEEIDKILITASGGSFRDRPLDTFGSITIADTLKHPTWSMGAKVTIDSATMFNKGLEVIEAHWLFDMPYEQIEAIIHPQSIIHSMVKYRDGSHIAQISNPSMQIPIMYALSYPKHIDFDNVKTDFLNMPPLTFREIEKARYPLFYLALDVAKKGGILPTVMNAANEACIYHFLRGEIEFTDFNPIISHIVGSADQIVNPDIETIIEINKRSYVEASKYCLRN